MARTSTPKPDCPHRAPFQTSLSANLRLLRASAYSLLEVFFYNHAIFPDPRVIRARTFSRGNQENTAMLRPAALALAVIAAPAFAQTIIFVNANLTTGADDGTSWANAYRGPQALKRAMDNSTNSQVWVAQGRYPPAPPAGDRRAAFTMKSGV